MAHFAKVVNGIVQQIIVAEPEFFDTFVDDTPGEWVQTSYNSKGGKWYDPETGIINPNKSHLRYNYAGIGYIYDSENDAFYTPQPFPSWTLNTSTFIWESPVPYPSTPGDYVWNEEDQAWVGLDS